MATQITATLPTLDFPLEADYPTQEDWAAFSAAAEENFGILGGSWSTQMQLWKTEANAMSIELNNNADIINSASNYQGDWVSQGYTLGQSVSVSGIYYICKLTHTTGQNPTAVGSIYWNLALGNWNLKADKIEVALKIDKNMSAYTTKSTPIDADLIPLSDSATSFGIKKLTWANLKATLKTYFDTLYFALTGSQTVDGIKTFTSSPIVPTPSSLDNSTKIATTAFVVQNINNATVNLTVGAIGSYSLLLCTTVGQSIIADSLYSGSSLKHNGYQSVLTSGGSVAAVTVPSSTVTGTWRAMGNATVTSGSYANTLFLRIS